MTDKEIIDKAIDFAHKNKKSIAEKFVSSQYHPKEESPVSIFMAGSPGAGKTEFSLALIQGFSNNGDTILRIDPDDFRVHFIDYLGNNSFLFQGAVTILIERIHDLVLKNKQSFIFDGTFSHLEIARKNIKRSIDKGRYIEIVFVYQEPKLAWEFTKRREKKEGRNIPKEAFIESFLKSQVVAETIKNEFGDSVKLNLVIRNLEKDTLTYHQNISSIRPYLGQSYTQEDLEVLLKEG